MKTSIDTVQKQIHFPRHHVLKWSPLAVCNNFTLEKQIEKLGELGMPFNFKP